MIANRLALEDWMESKATRTCAGMRRSKIRLRPENTMRGVSLLETALALAVVTLMAFGLGASVGPAVERAREEAVLDQLQRIKNGLVGDVQTIAPGQMKVAPFGFVGGMGSLPASLDELVAPDSQPLFAIDSTRLRAFSPTSFANSNSCSDTSDRR